jgi:hypothetical protein
LAFCGDAAGGVERKGGIKMKIKMKTRIVAAAAPRLFVATDH